MERDRFWEHDFHHERMLAAGRGRGRGGGPGGPFGFGGGPPGGRVPPGGGPFGFGGGPPGGGFPPGGGPPNFGLPWALMSLFRRGTRARRGDVRTAILSLLAEAPRNGYQIMQELEQRSGGSWRPS